MNDGEYVINADIANLVLQTMNNPLSLFGDLPSSIDTKLLRKREIDVLDLMRQGIVNTAELGEKLGITPRAVSNLISAIVLKLHMRSRYSLQHEVVMDQIRSEGMHNLEEIGEIIRVASTPPRNYGYEVSCWTIDSLTEVLLDEDIISRSPFT